MVTRWIIVFMGLMGLLLTACDNAAEETTTTTTAVDVNTALPTEIPASNTPIVVATLPPVVDLQAASAAPRATRTPAPTITPAPSRTTDLMIPITPDTATPEGVEEAVATPDVEGFEGVDRGPTIRLTYGDITGRLREYERPFTEDVLVVDTMLLDFGNGVPHLTFDVRIDGAEEATNVTAEVLFNYDAEQQRVFVLLGIVYLTDDPAQTYDGELMQFIKDMIQRSFNDLLVESYNSQMGQNRGFSVTDLRVTEAELAISTTRGG